MKQYLHMFAIVVRDYDEAIEWFTTKLNFQLVEDTPLSDIKRWVRIKPPGENETSILLAKASNEVQEMAIGNQAGGRVWLFLYTDDIHRDHQMLVKNEVEIERPMSSHEYGTVLVFKDLYGNLWDLIQPS